MLGSVIMQSRLEYTCTKISTLIEREPFKKIFQETIEDFLLAKTNIKHQVQYDYKSTLSNKTQVWLCNLLIKLAKIAQPIKLSNGKINIVSSGFTKPKYPISIITFDSRQ